MWNQVNIEKSSMYIVRHVYNTMWIVLVVRPLIHNTVQSSPYSLKRSEGSVTSADWLHSLSSVLDDLGTVTSNSLPETNNTSSTCATYITKHTTQLLLEQIEKLKNKVNSGIEMVLNWLAAHSPWQDCTPLCEETWRGNHLCACTSQALS